MTTSIGIDYRLRQLDVAILQGRKGVLLSEHALGHDVIARVAVLSRLVMDWRRDYGPCAVCLERPFANTFRNRRTGEERPNFKTTIDLSLLVGCIEGMAVAAGHAVRLVAPDQWRSAVMLPAHGRGREDKKAAAVRTVELEFGLRVRHDTADSILLAVYAQAVAKREAVPM